MGSLRLCIEPRYAYEVSSRNVGMYLVLKINGVQVASVDKQERWKLVVSIYEETERSHPTAGERDSSLYE